MTINNQPSGEFDKYVTEVDETLAIVTKGLSEMIPSDLVTEELVTGVALRCLEGRGDVLKALALLVGGIVISGSSPKKKRS